MLLESKRVCTDILWVTARRKKTVNKKSWKRSSP